MKIQTSFNLLAELLENETAFCALKNSAFPVVSLFSNLPVKSQLLSCPVALRLCLIPAARQKAERQEAAVIGSVTLRCFELYVELVYNKLLKINLCLISPIIITTNKTYQP